MAKEGLNIKNISSLVPVGKPWALCIGAGTSFPVFPSWEILAQRIVMHCSKESSGIIDNIKQSFSSEVILQSSYELLRSKSKDVDFPKILADLLYYDLLKKTSKKQEKIIKACMSSQVPSRHLGWEKFLNIMQQIGHTSANDLAKLIVEAYKKNANLNNIISFNAETLLPTLINAYAHIHLRKNDKILDYITEPTTSHYSGRIPFYFCHGLIPMPGVKQRWMNASDKLVFLENEYLQLANNAFSWQAISFFNILSTNTVFFIGLSFKDANIRRWLSWLHKARIDAIEKYGGTNESTAHYWIEKNPQDFILKKWYEASVAHLGIRLIWVDNWSEIPSVIMKAVEQLK